MAERVLANKKIAVLSVKLKITYCYFREVTSAGLSLRLRPLIFFFFERMYGLDEMKLTDDDANDE